MHSNFNNKQFVGRTLAVKLTKVCTKRNRAENFHSSLHLRKTVDAQLAQCAAFGSGANLF